MSEQKITTKDVLSAIAISGFVVSSFIFPSLPIALSAIHKQWKKVNKTDLGRIITRLKKQNMVSISEKNGEIQIRVTEKGKNRLLEYNFENIRIKSKRRDGKWRLIMFDIPEYKKSEREIFRKKLIQLGCVRVQDSVFACAFPCKDEVDFLSNYLEIVGFVTIVSLNKFESGEELIFNKLN